MPKNEHFIYCDDKMIVGKNNNEYNVLIFVRRDVKEINIPSFIRKIASYAFSETQIETVSIPPNITHICEGAFFNCKNIKQIEILPNSQLLIVEKDAFSQTLIDPNPILTICKNNKKFDSSNSRLMTTSNMQNDENGILGHNFVNHLKNENLSFSKEIKCENSQICKKTFPIPNISISGNNNQLISDLNYYSNLIYNFIENFLKEFNASKKLTLDISLIIPIKDFFDNLPQKNIYQSLDIGIILSLLKSVLSCVFFINDILNQSKDELSKMKSLHFKLFNNEKMKAVRQCKKTKSFNQKYTNFKKINHINKSENEKIRNERKELSNLLKKYFKENNNVVSLIDQIEESQQY